MALTLPGRVLLLTVALSACAGCLAPDARGPQLLRHPQGFALDLQCDVTDSVIPGRLPEPKRCYMRLVADDLAERVAISRIHGAFDMDGLRAAHAEYAERRTGCVGKHCVEIDPPVDVRLDGRPGIAWETRTIFGERLKVRGYSALVFDDDAAYWIEYLSLLDPPTDVATMRAVVHTFGVRTGNEYLWLKIVALLLAAAGAVVVWRHLRKLQELPVRDTAPIRPQAAPGPAVIPRAQPAQAPAAATAAAPAPAAAGPRKPPLLDASPRVAAAARRYHHDAAGAIQELEELRLRFAPSPAVLHRLCLWYAEAGDLELALKLAQEALPILLRAGNLKPAAEIAARFEAQREQLGLTPAQWGEIERATAQPVG